MFDGVTLKVCTVFYQVRVGKSTWCSTWSRLNTSTVLYPVGKSIVFDRGLAKSMYCIVAREHWEVEGIRRGLTESIHCIVASESWRVRVG